MVRINGTPFGTEKFPNGETIFRTSDIKLPYDDFMTTQHISVVFEDDSDITKLIIAKEYIDDKAPGDVDTYLEIEYFPYSRMDRAINGFAFSLKYVCNIINRLGFSQVRIADPHSNVVTALLNKCTPFYFNSEIVRICETTNTDYVFYPDNGAVKKYTECLDIGDIPYFYGNKKRELSTGKIANYELVNAPDINGKNILIIDDICVKGGTFILAAKALKEAGAKTVNLFVTHLEKAVYDGDLLTTDWVDRIYTANTMRTAITSDKIAEV